MEREKDVRNAFLAVLVLATSQAAHAQIYRCKDLTTGRTIYSQTPCATSPSVEATGVGRTVTPVSKAQTKGPQANVKPLTKSASAAPAAHDDNPIATPEYKVCWASITGIEWGSGVTMIPSKESQAKIDSCVRRLLKKQRLARPSQNDPPMNTPPAASAGSQDFEQGSAPSYTKVRRCTGSGCWGTDNNFYGGSGRQKIRSDGKVCIQSGATITCD